MLSTDEFIQTASDVRAARIALYKHDHDAALTLLDAIDDSVYQAILKSALAQQVEQAPAPGGTAYVYGSHIAGAASGAMALQATPAELGDWRPKPESVRSVPEPAPEPEPVEDIGKRRARLQRKRAAAVVTGDSEARDRADAELAELPA